jgi:uncharacterized protein YkvS
MSKPKFADIFSGDFLGYVIQYCKDIQEILNRYEVVIFMARKAVCFYKAMVLNGELIVPSSCNILSNRIANYNVMEKYKDKKIAVVDDVVIKGDSLKRVVSKLNEHGIIADILIVACNETMNIKVELEKSHNHLISSGYVVLEQKDIYSFAGMITEYIEASMCPFNIDQPIYKVDIENSALQEFLYRNYALDITTGIQQNYGITNNVIYLTINNAIPDNSQLFLLKDSILKIRILSNEYRTIAVPFVLFPIMTDKQLEQIFSLVQTDDINALTKVESERLSQENKLKIVSYFLSEMLITSFLTAKDVTIEKQEDNDVFQFTKSTCMLFKEVLSSFQKNNDALLDSFTSVFVEYSKFEFSDFLASCFHIISQCDPENQNFINSEGELIKDEIIITHRMLYQNLNTATAPYFASCAIDIFIDRGMIVPSIVHTENDNIIRAYKLGEYSKLTRSQIESFAAMLFQYQEMIKNNLNKTEFEKLCVLFFRTLMGRGIVKQQEKYEDGCYSICYSLYGPRVSTGTVSYKVGSDSALITDFNSPDHKKRLVFVHKGKYIIKAIGAASEMKGFTSGFAYQYSGLWKVFEKAKDEQKNKKFPWNRYVRTYIQYLTLRAIGNNKKNQYLSLCAELHQIALLPERFFELEETNKNNSKRILSGIDSGLWKYWCYSNDALDMTTEQIVKKDEHAGAILLLDMEPPYDKNKDWQIAIDNAGKLLYEIAFFINEVLKAKYRAGDPSTNDGISGTEKDSNTEIFTFKDVNGFEEDSSNMGIFKYRSYDNPDVSIKEIRQSVEDTVAEHSKTSDFNSWYEAELKRLKDMARWQLDLCDVILSNNSPSVTYYTKYLIVYSRNGVFPCHFSLGNVARQNLRLDGLLNNGNVKVFGFTSEQKALPFLSELLTNQEQGSLLYLVLDLDDPKLMTGKQSHSERGKNSILISKINEIIKRFENEKTENDLVVVSPKIYSSANINSHLNSSSVTLTEKDLPSIIKYIGEHFVSPFGTSVIVNNFTIVQGDNNGIINGVNFNSDHEKIKQELKQLILEAMGDNKKKLEEVQEALNQKDESRFKKALKEAGSFISGVVSKLTASIIFEYMKQNGLVP